MLQYIINCFEFYKGKVNCMYHNYSLGIDIGSTTAKLVLTDGDKIIYENYRRHFSKVRQTAFEMLTEMRPYLEDEYLTAAVSGSAGLGIAKSANLLFIQEVYALSLIHI